MGVDPAADPDRGSASRWAKRPDTALPAGPRVCDRHADLGRERDAVHVAAKVAPAPGAARLGAAPDHLAASSLHLIRSRPRDRGRLVGGSSGTVILGQRWT